MTSFFTTFRWIMEFCLPLFNCCSYRFQLRSFERWHFVFGAIFLTFGFYLDPIGRPPPFVLSDRCLFRHFLIFFCLLRWVVKRGITFSLSLIIIMFWFSRFSFSMYNNIIGCARIFKTFLKRVDFIYPLTLVRLLYECNISLQDSMMFFFLVLYT